MEDNTPKIEHDKISFVEKYNVSPTLFAFITLFLIFFLYQIIGGIIALLFLGNDITKMNVNLLRLSTGIGQVLLILVPTIFLSKLLPTKIKDIFRINKISFLVVILVIIGTLSLQEVLQILLLMQEQIPLPEGFKILNELKKSIEESYNLVAHASSYPELSYVILIIALIPSFCEEFLFRGLLQHNFILGLGPKWGIIIGGIIFGLFHFNPFGIIPLILLGIFFGFLVYRSGSIFTAIIAHFINNFFATLSSFYIGSEDLFLKDSNLEITLEQIPGIFILLLISLFIFLTSLYFFIRETSKPKLEMN